MLALEDAMTAGLYLANRGHSIEDAFAAIEARLRGRAERIVKQAADNDARQLKTLGRFGRWMRDRLFPLFVPVIPRTRTSARRPPRSRDAGGPRELACADVT